MSDGVLVPKLTTQRLFNKNSFVSDRIDPVTHRMHSPADRFQLNEGQGKDSIMNTHARSSGQTDKLGTDERLFPGWPWVAVALVIPIAGYIGWGVSGRVDAAGPALIGGLITGAGLGLGEWFAGRGVFGAAPAWVASAAGFGGGLVLGAALVDYGTDIGELAAMGAISGVVLGAGPGPVRWRQQGRKRLAVRLGGRDADAVRARLELLRRLSASTSTSSSRCSARPGRSYSRCSADWSSSRFSSPPAARPIACGVSTATRGRLVR